MEQVRSLEPVSVVVGSFVIVQSPKVWLPTSSFSPQRHSLPVLGFILLPVAVAVLMNRNRLFLPIFADGQLRSLEPVSVVVGSFCYRPITESMVAHIQFFAAASIPSVLGFILLLQSRMLCS